MSIISSFKKAFGFPDEYDEEELESPESDTEEEAGQPEVTEAAEPEVPVAETSTDIGGLSGAIFDAVIELFNSTQPEFVKECLSTEAQRAYIINHMEQGVRKRIEDEIAAARAHGEKLWEVEKRHLAADLDKIKTEYNSLKQQKEEFQSAQLSAARQKRALNERIQDLESKVTNLEAEKEQFQLENRSMLNKLRAAGVRGGGDSEEQLQHMAEENLKLQDSIKELGDKLQASEAEAANLRDTIAEIQRVNQAKAEEDEAAMNEIEAQISQFENIKKKKDAKIASLQESVKKHEAEAEALRRVAQERDTTIASLRSTIEANLVSHASAESQLREEIARLSKVNDEVRVAEVAEPRQSYKKAGKSSPKREAAASSAKPKTVKISAIDELMESTDWFVAPDPTPLKKDPEVEEAFGYKEPVKKTSKDDDKQLSLW